MSSTMAVRLPSMRLKSVDLPTLGRPIMATIGGRADVADGTGAVCKGALLVRGMGNCLSTVT